jgi:hypothetical protein
LAKLDRFRGQSLEDLALHMAGHMAGKAIRRHGDFPHHEFDDLKHHAYLGIMRAFADGKYDPSKGQKTTFMYKVAWGDLEDLREKMILRKSQRVDANTPTEDVDLGEAVIFDDERPLIDWLRDVFQRMERRYAQERFSEAPRMGRPSYWRPEQRAALTLLQARLCLSVRGMANMLASHPELRDALKITRIPNRDFLHDISKSVRKVVNARRRMALKVA